MRGATKFAESPLHKQLLQGETFSKFWNTKFQYPSGKKIP